MLDRAPSDVPPRLQDDAAAAGSHRPAPPSRADCAAALPLGAIVGYIRSNLTRRITLTEIAGVAQVSVFQLTRAFRRESATTPYRLVLALRIEHAKALLVRGTSIADAACGAGFADQSHFTRHFRRSTGLTPKRFRDAAKTAP